MKNILLLLVSTAQLRIKLRSAHSNNEMLTRASRGRSDYSQQASLLASSQSIVLIHTSLGHDMETSQILETFTLINSDVSANLFVLVSTWKKKYSTHKTVLLNVVLTKVQTEKKHISEIKGHVEDLKKSTNV